MKTKRQELIESILTERQLNSVGKFDAVMRELEKNPRASLQILKKKLNMPQSTIYDIYLRIKKDFVLTGKWTKKYNVKIKK